MTIDYPIVISVIALIVSVFSTRYTIKTRNETTTLRFMEKRTELLTQLLSMKFTCADLHKYGDEYMKSIPLDHENTKKVADIAKNNLVMVTGLLNVLKQEIENIEKVDMTSIKVHTQLETVNSKVIELTMQMNKLKEGAIELNNLIAEPKK